MSYLSNIYSLKFHFVKKILKMKNILYATDCSKHDTHTLQYALMLSDVLKANLTVLHIFSLPPIVVKTIRPKKFLSEHAYDEQLLVLKNYCSNNLKDIETDVVIKYEVKEDDSVTDGILSEAAILSPDLLILGMKDEHTSRGSFTGSIAKALIEKAAAPLFIVPSKKAFQNIKTLVYATDFEETDFLAIKKLVDIAKPFDAVIKVVHITNKDEYAVNDKMAWFKEMLFEKTSYRNITFDINVNNNIYEGLRGYINEVDADMIALLEREQNGFLKKLFHKDLIKKMESKIEIPMLSLKATAL